MKVFVPINCSIVLFAKLIVCAAEPTAELAVESLNNCVFSSAILAIFATSGSLPNLIS